MFQSERMWFVYTSSYCEIEWEEMCVGISESKKIEQWLNLKFLVKLDKSGVEINEMLFTVYCKDI